MIHKRKIAVGAAAILALLTVAATYFGGVAVVNTMHGETNYFSIVLGNHAASVVRKISPSNAVDALEAHAWQFGQAVSVAGAATNLASLFVTSGSSSPFVQIFSAAADSLPVLHLENDAQKWSLYNLGNTSDAFAIYDTTAASFRLTVHKDGSIDLRTNVVVQQNLTVGGQITVSQGTNGIILNTTNGVPATPGTIVHWVPIKLNGTNGFVPLYQ